MSNDFFKFRQFTVWHDRCAMKTGTDGVLLGAWANGGSCILDIGTGSGLIALFMAQRFKDAFVTAIDIDDGAYEQAGENVNRSVFKSRINVIKSSLQLFQSLNKYDAIVCNPPFFNNSLKNKDNQRTVARHTDSLSYRDLFRGVASLLDDEGEFSAIIPSTCRSDFDMEALFAGLYPRRLCAIKTVPRKPVSRYLLSYGKRPVNVVEESALCLNDSDNIAPEWFHRLKTDFYL